MGTILLARCPHEERRTKPHRMRTGFECFLCECEERDSWVPFIPYEVTKSIVWRCSGLDYACEATARAQSESRTTIGNPIGPQVRRIVKRTLRKAGAR